jgi:hypothetical protein
MDSTYRELAALAERYTRTEVAEHERKLYVREGRRVVAVVDLDGYTVEARKPHSPREANRLTEVMEICGFEQTCEAFEVLDREQETCLDIAYIWLTADGTRSPVAPRTKLSILTHEELNSDAAREQHDKALGVYWEDTCNS